MKKIILLTVLLAGSLVAFAQQEFQEVVYLKNGSILRGTIIEQIPNKSLKIQLNDGSIFVYEIDMVEKITKEPLKTAATKRAQVVQNSTTPQYSGGSLTARGIRVFSDGRQLSKDEVRDLFNAQTFQRYNRGRKLMNSGTVLLTAGIVFNIIGGISLLAYSEGYDDTHAYISAGGFIIGVITFNIGVPLRVAGRARIKKSVAEYNEGLQTSGYTSSLQFGFTGNGVGLVYTF